MHPASMSLPNTMQYVVHYIYFFFIANLSRFYIYIYILNIIFLYYFFYQSGKQVVENEVNGHQWSPHMSHCYQGLIHDVHPTFLSEDLKHGHEGLQKKKNSCNQSVFSRYSFLSSDTSKHLNYLTVSEKKPHKSR